MGIFKSEKVFLTVTILIVLFLFVILSPKLSDLLFSFKRQMVLNDFLSSVKEEKNIDGKTYWQFREFYSPGYFVFSKKGLVNSVIKSAQKEIGINYNGKGIFRSFLFFSSQKLDSLDMLTSYTDLNKLTSYVKVQKKDVVFENKNSLIYKADSHTIKIIFLISGDQMQKVNGISDYVNFQSIKGENWFNVTSLNTN
jgi:hypothetical protein